jgi:hypothetical protein
MRVKKERAGDEAEAVVAYNHASERQGNTALYVERGRQFQNATGEELRALYIEELRVWASTPPPWRPFIRFDDIQSELDLRGIEVSGSDVEVHLKTLVRTIKSYAKENRLFWTI